MTEETTSVQAERISVRGFRRRFLQDCEDKPLKSSQEKCTNLQPSHIPPTPPPRTKINVKQFQVKVKLPKILLQRKLRI